MIRVMSCFAQVLSLVDRRAFRQAVREHGAERGAKGFTCWDQFVGMLFCQLGSANSLREICGGLATALGKLVHLGLKKAPGRSTLAYANAHRPWQLYRSVFEHVLTRCRDAAATKRRRFRFKNPLRSLDATVIPLCLEMFNWAAYRRKKGAIKLHMQLDHQGYLPCWALITDGKTHDVRPARGLCFEPGTIVVFDRGYTDYRLFGRYTDEGVFFVTRAKDNLRYEIVEVRPVPSGRNVISDQVIRLSGPGASAKCPHLLRLVAVWDPEQGRVIRLLTNHLEFAASTISAIYKDRWQIEIFFKALKQNLKIKTFVGTSENAVWTQIWTALIAMLILKYLQLRSTWNWSLSNLAALLRMNLLTYRDLWAWLDNPFQVPLIEPEYQPLPLFDQLVGQQTHG